MANIKTELTLRKIAMLDRFGIPATDKRIKNMRPRLMDQVEACKSIEAQRLILGVSELERAESKRERNHPQAYLRAS